MEIFTCYTNNSIRTVLLKIIESSWQEFFDKEILRNFM